MGFWEQIANTKKKRFFKTFNDKNLSKIKIVQQYVDGGVELQSRHNERSVNTFRQPMGIRASSKKANSVF